MIRQVVTTLSMFLLMPGANAQMLQFSSAGDTTSKVTIEGYADVYFGFDFSQPKDAVRPYFVSYSRHNEFNINLAYISARFSSERVRATFIPGFGTYMNANYAAERITLRNIVEANVGIRLFKKRNIWMDAGVLSAPYTNETAISFDQLLYTRSFGPEYTPYYVTGAKLSLPLSRKVNLFLYLLNGWQQIEDVNAPLAFGSQLEYKPTGKLSLNLTTFLGNERSLSAPNIRGRYFADFYALYTPVKKLSVTLSAYYGRQTRFDTLNAERRYQSYWWQANVAGRFTLNKNTSLSARAEYFDDPELVMIRPITGLQQFSCSSYSLCYNVSVTRYVLFRVEGRYFYSPRNIFYDKNEMPVSNNALIIGGLTARF